MFKPGDKVRAIAGRSPESERKSTTITFGDIYTVKAVLDYGNVFLEERPTLDRHGRPLDYHYEYPSHWFELFVEPTIQSKPTELDKLNEEWGLF